MSHIDPEQFEQYVIGALGDEAASALEAHTASCQTCAAALQREAQLELGLMEVAALPVPLSARRPRRFIAATALSLAAAAGLAFFANLERPPPAEGAPRLARCDVSGSSECVARAQFDGVITIGPDHQVLVPKYEVTGQP